MATARYHKVKIGEHELNAETLMLGYGYDPSLSEGSVKPPVFLTSTFVFQTAEQGRDFFDYLAGAPPVEGQTSAGRGRPKPLRRTAARSFSLATKQHRFQEVGGRCEACGELIGDGTDWWRAPHGTYNSWGESYDGTGCEDLRRAALALIEETQKNPLEAQKARLAALTPSQFEQFATLKKLAGADSDPGTSQWSNALAVC